jgi:hypothetical protein
LLKSLFSAILDHFLSDWLGNFFETQCYYYLCILWYFS